MIKKSELLNPDQASRSDIHKKAKNFAIFNRLSKSGDHTVCL